MQQTKLEYVDFKVGIEALKELIKRDETQVLINRFVLKSMQEEIKKYSPPPKPQSPPGTNSAVQ